MAPGIAAEAGELATRVDVWRDRVERAATLVGTPCYVAAWEPVQRAVDRLRPLQRSVPIRLWLSLKTHPLPHLAASWLRAGSGVEVVSEVELRTALSLGCDADHLLVNGVAKHTWLARCPIRGLRVHFDSLTEIARLLPVALANRWRVGVRCHAPTERDVREPIFGGQFGLDRAEAVAAIRQLQTARADLQSVHFHLGQGAQEPDAYERAVEHVAGICHETGFSPSILDCGGGLPPAHEPSFSSAIKGLDTALQLAPRLLPSLQEIWLENGRFVSGESAALVIRVVDVKERPECRYVICDGGRTNHALAADVRPHPITVLPDRSGPRRLTTVCGPTCMTDDRLGRWLLPDSVSAGDLIVWLDAGAYHLPWETRFSHGLCAVAWCDENNRMTVARQREQPQDWLRQWTAAGSPS